jgi:hypothetical protein
MTKRDTMTHFVYIDPDTAAWGSAENLAIGEITEAQHDELVDGSDWDIQCAADELTARRSAVQFKAEDAQRIIANIEQAWDAVSGQMPLISVISDPLREALDLAHDLLAQLEEAEQKTGKTTQEFLQKLMNPSDSE